MVEGFGDDGPVVMWRWGDQAGLSNISCTIYYRHQYMLQLLPYPMLDSFLLELLLLPNAVRS